MKSDVETLKKWCTWKLDPGASQCENDREAARIVMDVISQTGTWKSKFEKMKESLDVAMAAVSDALTVTEKTYDSGLRRDHATRTLIEKLRAIKKQAP